MTPLKSYWIHYFIWWECTLHCMPVRNIRCWNLVDSHNLNSSLIMTVILSTWEYIEHSSKNNQGGLRSLHSKPKVVCAFENKEQPKCCLVCIFEKYVEKQLSHDPKCSKDLYLWPLAKPLNPHMWYSCQPISLSTLSKVIAKLCDAAGMVRRYSNHSLRSTAATHMYDQKMDK